LRRCGKAVSEKPVSSLSIARTIHYPKPRNSSILFGLQNLRLWRRARRGSAGLGLISVWAVTRSPLQRGGVKGRGMLRASSVWPRPTSPAPSHEGRHGDLGLLLSGHRCDVVDWVPFWEECKVPFSDMALEIPISPDGNGEFSYFPRWRAPGKFEGPLLCPLNG
jgi:hypothetical protein